MKIGNYQDTGGQVSYSNSQKTTGNTSSNNASSSATDSTEDSSGSQSSTALGSGFSVSDTMEENQNQINQKLMEAVSTFQSSLKDSDGALGLVMKTVMDRVSESLNEDGSSSDSTDSSSQTGSTSGTQSTNPYSDSQKDYWSPENTAKRIVAFGTGFFGQYLDQHSDKDLETALSDFSDLISGGIDKGFDDAKKLLDGMGLLQGDVSDNIDATYELVQKGLKDFFDNYPRPDSSSSTTTTSS
ncbi:hypothetical protein C4K68_11985 [Pokkaliibacter plantistimulans]|uniref:DUF5610 domain-containing protein n=1 Tax=Proteobacteria bacterium 228 TaxID=2083153 RepID=A0A2S5KQJ9_9PROT|nr:DUF5610 domain-containing protein [Pokkaliibacter plantistimulans]PPC77127.1 hypothetical protein C4K68_11985 [Pokkaliibacter plantistimulans]